jgi:hypothetical protein
LYFVLIAQSPFFVCVAVFEVERIVERRGTGSRLRFLVKWKGYSDAYVNSPLVPFLSLHVSQPLFSLASCAVTTRGSRSSISIHALKY